MWESFIWQNIHFTVHLFAALILFSIAWLYFDVWFAKKKKNTDLIFCISYILLSISFLISSIPTQLDIFPTLTSLQNSAWLLRSIGYICLVYIQVQKLNSNKNLHFVFASGNTYLEFIKSILPLSIAATYYIEAKKLRDKNALKLCIAFCGLFLYEIFYSIPQFFNAKNIFVYNFTKPFSWNAFYTEIILMLTVFCFVLWLIKYLFKQMQVQLFIFIQFALCSIFLLITFSFSFLLVKNIQDMGLRNLNSEARILTYSIDTQTQITKTDSEYFASNPLIIQYVKQKEKQKLASASESFVQAKKEDMLIVIDKNAIILASGHNNEIQGNSLSANEAVQASLQGKHLSGIYVPETIVVPEVFVASITPIFEENQVIGAVIIGKKVDSELLTKLKNSIGKEIAIYAGNQLAVSTFQINNTTINNIKLGSSNIEYKVLVKGEEYVGPTKFLDTTYLSVYLPLRGEGQTPQGIIFIGEPQTILSEMAERAVATTALFSLMLLIILLPLISFISKYISSQYTIG